MEIKRINEIPKSTVTRSNNAIDGPTNNIYEAMAIIAKRADQIGNEIKLELGEKLEEFASANENLEEIFENKEQIEVSKYYEALPKPVILALEEWKRGEVYFRRPGDSDPEFE